jgi:hypothetical protein
MLDKKISVSEDIANLTTEAQLLFTWMIPHADDAGLLPHSPRSIKALVVPMKDWTIADIGIQLESMREANLIEVFEWEGDRFWHINAFAQHQTLKRDRKPQTIAKNLGDWKTLDSIWKPKEVSKEEKEGSNQRGRDFLKRVQGELKTKLRA